MWLIMSILLLGTIPDSSGVREVSSWPFGPSYSLAEDTVRNLVFLGSGAGVLVLQPENTGGFSVMSDGIRTEGGNVRVIRYDHQNQILFTGGDNSNLEAWSVSDPSNPARIFRYQDTVPQSFSEGYVADMIIYNGYIFVAFSDNSGGNFTGSVKIFSSSNPGQVLGTLNTSASIGNIYIENSRLFVQTVPDSVYVYNISNVTNPQFLTAFSDNGDMVIVDDTLLFSFTGGMWGGGMNIYNISDLNNPVQINATSFQLTELRRVKKYGNAIFVCGEWLDAWDVTNPQNPSYLWSFGLSGGSGINDFSLESGAYLAASGIGGLSVIDFDSLGVPYESSSFRVPGDVLDLAGGNGYLYHFSKTVGGTVTLTVLHQDEFSGILEIPVSASFVKAGFANGTVYFVSDSIFVSVDVTDPQNPVVQSSLNLPHAYHRDMAISGNFAFLTADSGIYVIQLDSMRFAGSLQDTSLLYGTKSVAISGNYLYLAYGMKLAAIDISDPLNPTILSVEQINQAYGNFKSIVVNRSYAYISTDVNQIIVMGIADPAHPSFAGAFSPPDNRGYGLYNLEVTGNYLLGTTGSNYSTLVAFDLSNPASPEVAAYYDNYYNLANAVHFVADGNTVFLADYTIGVHVLSLNPTGVWESDSYYSALKVSLNRLSFSLPGDGYFSLRIYDASGRLQKEFKGFRSRGNYTLNLSDLSGGVYFYSLKTGTFRRTGKILVVK